MRAGAERGVVRCVVLPLVKLLAAETLGHAGRLADGLTAIEDAIDYSGRTGERWLIADLLRIKGDLLMLQDPDGTVPVAQDHFRRALDWARRQGDLRSDVRSAKSAGTAVIGERDTVSCWKSLRPSALRRLRHASRYIRPGRRGCIRSNCPTVGDQTSREHVMTTPQADETVHCFAFLADNARLN